MLEVCFLFVVHVTSNDIKILTQLLMTSTSLFTLPITYAYRCSETMYFDDIGTRSDGNWNLENSDDIENENSNTL